MTTTAASEGAVRSRSLWALFTLKLGERFAFYFSLAILSQYLGTHLNLSEAEAGSLIYTLTWGPYAFLLLGAVVADRWLGHQRSVLLGWALLVLGCGLLALPHAAPHAAMSALVAGYALVLPTLPALTSMAFAPPDRRRDWAFMTVFYASELGGFLGPLGGYAATKLLGWGQAFSMAGTVLLACLGAFLALGRSPADPPTSPRITADRQSWRPGELALVLGSLLPLFLAGAGLRGILLPWCRELLGQERLSESHALLAVLGGATAILFFPMVIVLARLSGTWRRLRGLSAPALVGWSMVLALVSHVLVLLPSLLPAAGEQAVGLWLGGSAVLQGLSEIALLPVGLSLVLRLVPRRWAATAAASLLLMSAGASRTQWLVLALWERWPHAGVLGLLAALPLLATALWISQLRRIEAASRVPEASA